MVRRLQRLYMQINFTLWLILVYNYVCSTTSWAELRYIL